MSTNPPRLPKMMLGFVVRRCTIALGHRPTAAEFVLWANAQTDDGREHCIFGRPITEREADLILRHQARLVSARSASALERYVEPDELAAPKSNVVQLGDARESRRRVQQTRR